MIVWPGLRRSVSAISRLFNSASFDAPLTHSAIPTRAATGTAATFTRATTKTVTNNDGYLVTLLAGEIGFPGARRVRNLLPSSESFATGWQAPGASSVSANAILSPIGTLTADALIEDGTTAYHRINHASVSRTSGQVIAVSVYAKYAGRNLFMNWSSFCNATGAFDLQTGAVTQGVGVASIEALDDGWYRCTVIGTCTVTGAENGYLQLTPTNVSGSYAGDGTSGAYFWGAQLEDVTAQTTQTAGEYVSVGALDYRSENNQLYLSLPGTAGHYASTPDSAANSITGDIAIVSKVRLSDWTPAADTGLVAKWDTSVFGTRAFIFIVDATTGKLHFYWTTDGTTTVVTGVSTVAPTVVDGAVLSVAATLDVNNGAGGYDLKFWTSTDGSAWTQLGSTVVGGAPTSVYDSNTYPITLGGDNDGSTGNLTGGVYSAQLYNGIPPMFGGGGSAIPVIDFNPHRDATTPTGTITSSTTGEVWTINGASSVIRSVLYHGSGVDGVKCFPTDLSGNAIPSTTLLGYSAEGARTNLCLQSNAFTTTWGIISAPTITQNVVGPDGATSAWTLTDDSDIASEGIAQSILLTAAAHTFSVFVKKTTGAQTSYPVVYAASATHIAPITIDTSNGVATVWSAYTGFTIASGLSATCTSFNDNFWRAAVTFTASAANWSLSLIPAGTTNATQSTGTLDATAKGSAVFYGAQVELGSFASSYIATTTIAVARNADVLTYSSAGNIDGTKGWAYAEWTYPRAATTTTSPRIINTGAGSAPLYLASAIVGDLGLYDGAVRDGPTPAYPVTTPTKSASTWGGTAATITNAGVSVTTAFDGDMNVGSTIDIGCINGTGGFELNGTIRNVHIGQRALSSSELQAVTA